MPAPDHHMPPPVEMKPHDKRIVEAILLLIAEGKKHGRALSQYDIVKALFLADKAHLNKYGRPITFDNYAAMKHGPVPSTAYDMLKSSFPWQQRLGIAGPPWVRVDDPAPKSKRAAFYASRDPNLDFLSESDVEELRDALSTVRLLGFAQIRKLTHEDPAYTHAWRDDEEAQSFRMSYGMFFETPDFEAAEELARDSASC